MFLEMNLVISAYNPENPESAIAELLVGKAHFNDNDAINDLFGVLNSFEDAGRVVISEQLIISAVNEFNLLPSKIKLLSDDAVKSWLYKYIGCETEIDVEGIELPEDDSVLIPA